MTGLLSPSISSIPADGSTFSKKLPKGNIGRALVVCLGSAAWLIQFSIAVVLPQALLLLHGEAGPMTSAFQPEQPARLPKNPHRG